MIFVAVKNRTACCAVLYNRTMTKSILIIVGAIVVLAVAYWLVSPLFIDVEVSESLEDLYKSARIGEQIDTNGESAFVEPEIVRQGTFVSLAGHSAKGTATLVKTGTKYYVRFEDDFEMTNGPDLFVHFGENDAYAVEARLGALKGNVGGQNYEVPEGIDPLAYDEVWVWCRAFAVPFGKAVLKVSTNSTN